MISDIGLYLRCPRLVYFDSLERLPQKQDAGRMLLKSLMFSPLLQEDGHQKDGLFGDGAAEGQAAGYAKAVAESTIEGGMCGAGRAGADLPSRHFRKTERSSWRMRQHGSAMAWLCCFAASTMNQPMHIWYNKALVLNNMGNYSESAAALRRAVEASPECAICWNSLGLTLAKLEMFDEAIAAYDRAIELDADYLEP